MGDPPRPRDRSDREDEQLERELEAARRVVHARADAYRLGWTEASEIADRVTDRIRDLRKTLPAYLADGRDLRKYIGIAIENFLADKGKGAAVRDQYMREAVAEARERQKDEWQRMGEEPEHDELLWDWHEAEVVDSLGSQGRAVWGLRSTGHKYAEIGRILGIGRETVKTHLQRITKRLDAAKANYDEARRRMV